MIKQAKLFGKCCFCTDSVYLSCEKLSFNLRKQGDENELYVQRHNIFTLEINNLYNWRLK